MKWIEKVQLWKNGVMMTAQLKSEEAERMVNEGIAKRINDQAITYVCVHIWKEDALTDIVSCSKCGEIKR